MIVKIRYILISLIALPIILMSLDINGFTIVLNNSDNDVSVSVIKENKKYGLLSIFGEIFIGFPKMHESYYLIECNDSENSVELGYLTENFNREEIKNSDLSC